MTSGSRQKTTIAKLARERALRERRELKQDKKAARRRQGATGAVDASETAPERGGDAPRRDHGTGGA